MCIILGQCSVFSVCLLTHLSGRLDRLEPAEGPELPYDCKQKANKDQPFTVNKEESEKEELCLVEGEAMGYQVKATPATLRIGIQLPVSSGV